jgi:hypothetical protein
VNNWSYGLRERLAQLEAMGGDKTLAAQARYHLHNENLIEAEELISTVELRLKSWLRRS